MVKKTKIKYVLMLLGIIIVVVAIKAMVEGNNLNPTQQAGLKATEEQFSQDIKAEESRVADATTDTALVSAKSQVDIDKLKLAVDSAKKVYADTNHTQKDITESSNRLTIAEDVFDSATSTYQPEAPTSTDATDTSDTTVDTSDATNSGTGTDEEVWQYCVDRWAYYDTLTADGYSGDKYTEDVFNDASARFGVTASEAQATWDKVDKIKTGVTD